MKHISILGCGWLGLPLAQTLIKNGAVVKGSTTTKDKFSALENSAIKPFLISLTEKEIAGNCNDFLENSSILIINIPPKLRGNSNEDFVKKIETLIPHIERSSVEKVIFISSTSIYSDDNSIVTEDSQPQPESESGKQLLEVEHNLLSNTNFKTTCIRFGGLIGDDRHPIYYLAGKKSIENPEAPINLIHQLDCIGIIQKVIDLDCWNEVLNAVTPFHPTRKEYYTQKAIELRLSPPEFENNKPSFGKTILSKKINKVLNYNFQIMKL